MSEAAPFAAWIGATEAVDDDIDLGPVLGVAAALDDTESVFATGSPLPPLWHWFFFLARAPQSKIGHDGHPERGGFMPPIALPRRMFAGARMHFHRPLVIGRPARRETTIHGVAEKEGASGKLAFVTVGYAIHQDGRLCIEEQQDIVYRGPGRPVPPPEIKELPPVPEGSWSRLVEVDPVLLFRFSALTFNAHRIHYDRSYAVEEEGYPGLVVQGPLTALLLMELVRRRAGRPVVGFEFRGRAPLFDLAPFRILGIPRNGRVELKAQGPDGTIAITAVADLA